MVLRAIFVFLECNLELQFEATEINDDSCLSVCSFGTTAPNPKSLVPVFKGEGHEMLDK